MIEYGKINRLKVIKREGSEIILDGKELGRISLPKKELPARCRSDDDLEVFIYIDSRDRLVATTHIPYAGAGEFALLKVVSSNSYGAFLDWGIEQDLKVPAKEQQKQMKQGQSYIVYVYNDKNNRIKASSKLNKFLNKTPVDFREGQKVDLTIGDITPMGYRAIINGSHIGALYKNEVFQLLKKGQTVKGFIKKIREDGKIDLSLQKSGAREKNELSEKILNVLKENGGSLDISDKTSPERIYELFGVSKKRYKNAVGYLYKKRLIRVDDYMIRLVSEREQDISKPVLKKQAGSGRRIRTKRQGPGPENRYK